jgi:hypothetical protein
MTGDSSVEGATQYFYRVSATGDAGSSAPSNIATVATDPIIGIWTGTTAHLPDTDFGIDTAVMRADGSPDPIAQWVVNWGDGGSPVTIEKGKDCHG